MNTTSLEEEMSDVGCNSQVVEQGTASVGGLC